MNNRHDMIFLREDKKGKKVFRIVVVLLAALLVINAVFLIKNIRWRIYRSSYEYSEMKECLDQEDYPMISYMVGINDSLNYQTVKDTEIFSDFSDFYQAAFLYKAYREAGENEKAMEQLSKAKAKLSALDNQDFQEAVARVKALYGME